MADIFKYTIFYKKIKYLVTGNLKLKINQNSY